MNTKQEGWKNYVQIFRKLKRSMGEKWQKKIHQRVDEIQIAIPPGATIRVQLTVDMARRLELVLGAPLQFWCNLETIYREKLVKIAEENAMDAEGCLKQRRAIML